MPAARSEVEATLLLDEIAACEQPVGELLNGALGRVEGGCQLRKGHAAGVQGHGVEDLDHSVDGAMRTRRQVADASKPLRRAWMALDNRRWLQYIGRRSVYPVLYPELRIEKRES